MLRREQADVLAVRMEVQGLIEALTCPEARFEALHDPVTRLHFNVDLPQNLYLYRPRGEANIRLDNNNLTLDQVERLISECGVGQNNGLFRNAHLVQPAHYWFELHRRDHLHDYPDGRILTKDLSLEFALRRLVLEVSERQSATVDNDSVLTVMSNLVRDAYRAQHESVRFEQLRKAI